MVGKVKNGFGIGGMGKFVVEYCNSIGENWWDLDVGL